MLQNKIISSLEKRYASKDVDSVLSSIARERLDLSEKIEEILLEDRMKKHIVEEKTSIPSDNIIYEEKAKRNSNAKINIKDFNSTAKNDFKLNRGPKFF